MKIYFPSQIIIIKKFIHRNFWSQISSNSQISENPTGPIRNPRFIISQFWKKKGRILLVTHFLFQCNITEIQLIWTQLLHFRALISQETQVPFRFDFTIFGIPRKRNHLYSFPFVLLSWSESGIGECNRIGEVGLRWNAYLGNWRGWWRRMRGAYEGFVEI